MSDEDKGNVGSAGQDDKSPDASDAQDLDFKVEFDNLKAETEKQLESFKKEASKRDKTIDELSKRNDEKDAQIKELKRRNMPADELRQAIEDEKSQEQARLIAENTQLKAENEQNRIKGLRLSVIVRKGIKGSLFQALTETPPADEGELDEWLENIKALYTSEVVEEQNKFRFSDPLQVGDSKGKGGKSAKSIDISDRDWDKLTADEKLKLANSMSNEDADRLLARDFAK